MGATFPRVKVWSGNEDVSATDLNGEFDNVLSNLTPAGMDDYSASAAQMRIQTSPGAVGSESLATSGAGELERLRYALARLLGTTYWYESPAVTLAEANTLLSQIGTVPANRIVSCRVRTSSAQPVFLVPDGTAATVKLDGTPTPFVFRVAGVAYTISSDVTFTGLSTAPSTNNTCLVNDTTLAGQAESKYAGEEDSAFPALTIDTVGAEISSRVGQWCAFKVGTEAFFAYVDSATELRRAFRGYFFNSSDTPVVREVISNNDTITLLRLTWVFARTDGTLAVSYTNPSVSYDQPSAPNTGDYWFDLSAATPIWKVYNGGSFADATALLVGVCAQDTTGCKWARSFDPYRNFSDLNTLVVSGVSSNAVRCAKRDQRISVYGNAIDFGPDVQEWEMPGDLASGEAEGASTTYYVYVTELGDTILSAERPYAGRQTNLLGLYHPYQTWRAVARVANDAGSNFEVEENFYALQTQSVGPFQLAPRPVGGTAKAGGVAISSSCGLFSGPGTGVEADVTNLTVTLTTLGRPVRIFVMSDGTTAPAGNSGPFWRSDKQAALAVHQFQIFLYRDGSKITCVEHDTNLDTTNTNITEVTWPPNSIDYIDTPGPGVHTYKISMKNIGTSSIYAYQMKLAAYEL